ncbi:MAG: hypothetical protein JNM88_14675 [Chitinophagaceae bacterium]|nr:hypothetical protein [Chitinophagaceae bacterium]
MREIIRFPHGVRRYRLLVEEIYRSDQVIRYRVSGRNRSIVLQTNEPFFRNRGMKLRRPDWKLIEGRVNEPGFVNKIIEIMQVRRKELESKGL